MPIARRINGFFTSLTSSFIFDIAASVILINVIPPQYLKMYKQIR